MQCVRSGVALVQILSAKSSGPERYAVMHSAAHSLLYRWRQQFLSTGFELLALVMQFSLLFGSTLSYRSFQTEKGILHTLSRLFARAAQTQN